MELNPIVKAALVAGMITVARTAVMLAIEESKRSQIDHHRRSTSDAEVEAEWQSA